MNRKLLLLMLLLFVAGSSFASTLVQTNWRWRNDNGNEATATFRAGENVPVTITDYGVIRLRIRVENEGATDPHRVSSLKYSTSATDQSLFNDANVISDDASKAFVYAHGSGAPVNKTATTDIAGSLTKKNAAFTFESGQYFEAERSPLDDADKATVTAGKYSDLEFVIKPTQNVVPGTTYYFLIQNAKESDPPGLVHNVASLTTGAVMLPVNFLSFEAKPVNNKVQLKWATASEKNNERFELSRSADAKNWQVIGSQLGKGNTDDVANYSFTDQKPLSGISYYELAQVDKDGTRTVLSTKAVNVSLATAVDVQVFPNPTAKEINIFIANYGGKSVEASLFSQDGKLVHKEQFSNDVQGKKLNINKMPSAGVYVLKVKGQELSVNKKVVIL